MVAWPPLPAPRARAGGKARFCAALALVLLAESLVLRRLDLIATETLLATLALALALALVGLLVLSITLRDIWRRGRTGAGGAALTLGLIVLTLSPFVAAAAALRLFPAVADASTDPVDPPAFTSVAAEPHVLFNLLPPDDAGSTDKTRADPDLQPLRLDLSTVEAYALVRAAVDELAWTTIASDEPGTETDGGSLQARLRSPLLGNQDDVAVRVTPDDGGARIDIRSASGYPLPDLGENARHVRALLGKLQDVARRSNEG